MPIYEYRCEKGHTFEVMQRMTDEPVKKCEVCGVPVQRVFHPVAVHFKGSGFYNTDYGKKTKGASKPSSSEDGASSNSDKSDSKPEKKKDSTAASSSSSSSD